MDLKRYESKVTALLNLLREHEVLSSQLPIGFSEACFVAEEFGLAYARKDLTLTSRDKAIWVWRITDAGRRWLKEREHPEVPPTEVLPTKD